MEVIKLRKTWNKVGGYGQATTKMHLVSSFIDKEQHIATYRYHSTKYGWMYETKPAWEFNMMWKWMDEIVKDRKNGK